MIRKERLVAILQKLVQAPSENPPGNEEKVAGIIGAAFSAAGLDVRTISYLDGRPNVLGTLKGKSSEKPIILIAHTDTIPAGTGWSREPFSAKIDGGKLYGLGTTDDKCHLAIMAEVAKSMQEDRSVPLQDIIFLAMADEEAGGAAGLVPLLENKAFSAKEAILLDGASFEVDVAQKGLVHAEATVFGMKAHGAYPALGRNAIEDSARIICALKENLVECEKNPVLGPPTINIGRISGGERVNVVADRCVLEIDARFPPPLRCADIREHLAKVINQNSEKYDLQIKNELEAVQISARDELVTGVCSSIKSAGRKPVVGGSAGSTLLALLVKHGIKGVSLGFGEKKATHAADEYVLIDDVYDGAVAIESFIKNYAGTEKAEFKDTGKG